MHLIPALRRISASLNPIWLSSTFYGSQRYIEKPSLKNKQAPPHTHIFIFKNQVSSGIIFLSFFFFSFVQEYKNGHYFSSPTVVARACTGVPVSWTT